MGLEELVLELQDEPDTMHDLDGEQRVRSYGTTRLLEMASLPLSNRENVDATSMPMGITPIQEPDPSSMIEMLDF